MVGPAASHDTNSLSALAVKRATAIAQEAAFLWSSRAALTRCSAITLDTLAQFDKRLSRLIDKLSERPGVAERLLEQDQSAFKSGLAFVTAVVSLRTGAVRIFGELVKRLETEADLLTPLAGALAWIDYDLVRGHVRSLLGGSSAHFQQLGLLAAIAHGVDPGDALIRALDAENSSLRASAFAAVGRLAMRDHLPRLGAALIDQDPTCRFWAAWSAVRLGDHAGIPVLGRFVVDGGAFGRRACDIALRALERDQAVRAYERLLSVAGSERLCVRAAGIIGDSARIIWLLGRIEVKSLARQAGAAFSLITGCDLRRSDLEGDGASMLAAAETRASDAARAEREDDTPPEDASLRDEEDDDLPWPDITRMRRWWTENGHNFISSTRYLAGRDIRLGTLEQVIRAGNQQQRGAAALELALRRPDMPFLDVAAPSHRQTIGSTQSL